MSPSGTSLFLVSAKIMADFSTCFLFTFNHLKLNSIFTLTLVHFSTPHKKPKIRGHERFHHFSMDLSGRRATGRQRSRMLRMQPLDALSSQFPDYFIVRATKSSPFLMLAFNSGMASFTICSSYAVSFPRPRFFSSPFFCQSPGDAALRMAEKKSVVVIRLHSSLRPFCFPHI